MRFFVCRLLVCAAVLATCPVRAEASDPTFHPVANLSNSANRASDYLDMATDGAKVYTVWREPVAPDAEELRFRVSNNHGASFGDGPGGRSILSIALPQRLFNVRIAAAGSTVLVLFSTGDDETQARLWLLRSTDGGASFLPTPVDVSGLDAAHHGDIAINTAGDAHIVIANVALGEIQHRRSSDAGATFSPAVNVSGTADVSRNPRVSVNGDNIAVVWEETGPDGTSPGEVAFAFSSDAGASFGPALNLSASAAPSDAPDVAFLDAIHVAWVEDGSVHYRRSADGSAFTDAVAIGVPPAGDVARTPAVSGVGLLLNVAWTTLNPSGASDGPFLRRSQDGGVNFGSPLDLGSSAGGPFDAVAIGGASPVKIAWPHSSSGSPAESDVLFLREIACGTTWLAAVSDVWTNAARWSSGVVPGSSDDVCISVAGSYTVTVRAGQSANSVVVGAAGATGQVLKIEGQRPSSTSGPLPATLTVGNGLTNFGRITLTSVGAIASGAATLTVSSGTLTNASGGTIETLQGSQGGRTITATAVNDGTINFGWDATLNGDHTNNHSVTLAAGMTLTLGGTAAFNQNNGSLSLTGTLVSTDGTFNFNGGDITGTPPVLTSATLNIGPASSGVAHFRMRRDSTLSGNIAAGQTVTIEAERPGSTSGPIHATLTATGGSINAGTIQLTSIGAIPSGSATLVAPTSSVLTNASTGRIEVLAGSQGGRVLSGRFSNTGTVQVSWPLTISGTNATFTNDNSFIIDSGSTLSMNGADDRFVQGGGTLDVNGTFDMVGGTFDFNGGTVETIVGSAGNVILESSALNFGPGSTGVAHFRLRRASTMTGNIAASQIVTIEAERPGSTSGAIHATVTVIGNLTSAGTIELTSIGAIASGTATLTVADGAVLTNASGGRIETIQGSQGGRAINGHVVNNGTVIIGWATSLGGTAAAHTNNGVFQVQATRTLSISGDETFVQGGGTLDVDGTFHMIGATFNFNGGSVDAGGAGMAILESSALNFGPDSTGGAHFRVRRASTLSGNIAAGQTVTIEAERPGSTSGAIHATLTASADFTNGGTIQLTSIGAIASGTATLAIAGTSVMTISSTGRLETLQGSQGGRVITGSFVNNGAVVIGWSVSLTGANATYTNNGSFVVNDGQTVSIAVSSSTFVQAGGTLDIEGTVNMNGATFNFNGGTVDAVGGLGNLQSAVLNFGAGSTGSAHFRLRRASTLTGNIAAGQTVTIEAERPGSTSGAIHATVTVVGNLTNAGTIQLTSIGAIPSGTATLTVADGAVLTNAAGGRIETLQGSQGARAINGDVVNHGTVVIGWSTSLGGTAATHTNNGLFQVQTGRTLSISGDETFVQGGGTLEAAGTFYMVGATFNFNGGSVVAGAGLAILESSALNFGPGATGAAHLHVRRGSTLSGNIAAGQTVTIEGERPGSTSGAIHATVTVLGNVTSAGTIQLTSIGAIPSGSATLTVAGGAVLTKASGGRIETHQGSQGGRAINGNVVNNGTIVVGWSTGLGGTAATHTNNGLFQVQTDRTLSISGDETFVQGGGTLDVDGTFHMIGATFNFNGGSVDAGGAGLAILESSALNFGPGTSGAAHLHVRRGSTLSGNIAAGQTVTIEGERPGSTSGPIHATVTVIGNVTNGGTIQLTSIGAIASGNATLTVSAGSVLTNASTGRIETLQGSQAGRFVNGSVRNEGAFAINWPVTYSAGTFRNVALGSITGGGTLTLANTSTFFGTGSVTANIFNSGQFNAGQSPGALSITGNYTQTASGSLNVEIGGFTAGTDYDLVAISGTATLAGTLNVSLFGGFCEAGTFDVLTYASGSGDFGTKNGLSQGGLLFTATRNATFYRLNATGECVSAPIANNDAYSVNEDGVLNVAAPGVLANDTDPQGTVLTAVLFTSPSHGDVVLDPNGSFTYTPTADFFGTDSFTYVANDGFENSAPATVTITVNAVNDPPNAVEDVATVDEDSGQNSVPVLANDETAPDAGETLTITAVTQGTSGVVVITGGGSGLTYAPNANFSGTDTFTYTVSDGVFTDVATVNIQVNAINDPPDAIDDAATVDEDSGANTIDVLTNDTTGGEAAETLSIEAVTQGANGVVAIGGGGTSLSYTPGPNFHGSDSFTYTIADGNGGTDTALVHVTVASVNDPPDAQDDAVSADEDSGANQIDVLANDTFAPDTGETLVIAEVTQGTNGTVAIEEGWITYTPHANFVGVDSFTYTISDGNGGVDTATVSVTVNGVNDPPDAVDDTASVEEDSAANVIDVLANDTFAPDAGETLAITAVTQGANGTVAITGGGTAVTYTPNADFAGIDSFSYAIADGNGGVDLATVMVAVTGVNDPPDAVDEAATVLEDSAANVIDVLANDGFAPDAGETLVVTAVTQGTHGIVAVDEGSVTYTPHANFAGVDTFTYTISDGNGGVDTAAVTVTVGSVNDAPDANDDSATVDENSGASSIDVLANDTAGPDSGETLVVAAITQAANGSVEITGAGSAVTYRPNANFSGLDEFTYTVADGHGGTDTATVRVTVRPVNTTDADEDGVPDDVDQCPGTPAGTVVNATGCAISQICSAAAPWKNHGQYVSCVSNTSAQFEILGLITAAQRNAMVSAAAKSNVGKK